MKWVPHEDKIRSEWIPHFDTNANVFIESNPISTNVYHHGFSSDRSENNF